jgi:hypothetical protein
MDRYLDTVFALTRDAVITAEAVGVLLALIIPERYRGAHEAGIERVVANNETSVIDQTVLLTGLHKAGHEVPIELSLAT